MCQKKSSSVNVEQIGISQLWTGKRKDLTTFPRRGISMTAGDNCNGNLVCLVP